MDIGPQKAPIHVEPATIPVPQRERPARQPERTPQPQRAPRKEPATPSTPRRDPRKVPAR